MPKSLSRNVMWGWLIMLAVIGAYIRVHGASGYAYNHDESRHINIASGNSLAEILRYALYEAHPPLFYILLHYWMMISTEIPFVRSLPLLFGLALIPVYYGIGRRISGDLCGLCCATLVTFSYGCVIQSYVMRQYCVLLLALSLSFYCYLHWRDTRRRSALMGYVLFGWLAALSHFSSDFYFLCMALFGVGELFRKGAGCRPVMEWILANMAIAAMAIFIYHLWQPYLSFLRDTKFYGKDFHTIPTMEQWLSDTLRAPFLEVRYLCPALPFFPILALYEFLPRLVSPRRTRLHPWLVLAGVACLMSMAVCVTRLYPILGTRHNLWMLPLLLPAMGGILADLLERAAISSGRLSMYAVAVLAVVLIVFSTVYDMRKKSHDPEYKNWHMVRGRR